MTLKTFLLQNISDFSDLQGDTCKARFVPTDGNLSLYPENYCRADILAGQLYVLKDGENPPDFTPFQNGSPPVLEIQFGPMLGGPLTYYLALPGSFDATQTTFTVTGDFGVQNAPDYTESYLSSGTINSSLFNQANFD